MNKLFTTENLKGNLLSKKLTETQITLNKLLKRGYKEHPSAIFSLMDEITNQITESNSAITYDKSNKILKLVNYPDLEFPLRNLDKYINGFNSLKQNLIKSISIERTVLKLANKKDTFIVNNIEVPFKEIDILIKAAKGYM